MNERAQRDAGTTGYSVREICRLVGISARQLGYWRLIGAVAPRVERHGAKTFYRYTDKDLRLLREVARLTAIGLPISKAVEWVRSGRSAAPDPAEPAGEPR
jgi:DNA-binding transcriptional MerR regulator